MHASLTRRNLMANPPDGKKDDDKKDDGKKKGGNDR